MDILMPQKVKFIIKQLMDNGFEAYAVGAVSYTHLVTSCEKPRGGANIP